MLTQIMPITMGWGGERLNTDLPKALIELQQQTISGPLTGAAANTAIAVADGIQIQDTIQKVLEFTAGVPSDITSTVSIVDLRASGTLTLTAVVAGNQVQVNGNTYTAVTFTYTPTNGQIGPFNFAVGANDTATALNLSNAINSADASLTCIAVTNVVTVIYETLGTAGNAVTLNSLAGTIVASGATLAGGSNTSAIKSTANTTGNTVLMFWWKKTRVVGVL